MGIYLSAEKYVPQLFQDMQFLVYIKLDRERRANKTKDCISFLLTRVLGQIEETLNKLEIWSISLTVVPMVTLATSSGLTFDCSNMVLRASSMP